MKAYIAYLTVDNDEMNAWDVADLLAQIPEVAANIDTVVWPTEADPDDIGSLLILHKLAQPAGENV